MTSSVTWPFDTHVSFSISGALEPSLYLKQFLRYCALRAMGSRVWPFKVTWRHRSRDRSISHTPFPIGAPLEPNLYLQRFPRYSTSNV